MRFHRHFSALALTTILTLSAGMLLTAGPAPAGWGDTLKAVGASAISSRAETAVKEVLTLGKDYAVETLGKDGGFSDNVYAAISLPDTVSSLASQAGLTSIINAAAEAAVPKLDTALTTTINGLTVDDPAALLAAARNSTGVTEYFGDSSRSALMALAKPIVESALDDAGLSAYATALTVVSKATGFDAVAFTTEQILDAVFHYMGEKEKDLRSSGAANASKLLQTFF